MQSAFHKDRHGRIKRQRPGQGHIDVTGKAERQIDPNCHKGKGHREQGGDQKVLPPRGKQRYRRLCPVQRPKRGCTGKGGERNRRYRGKGTKKRREYFGMGPTGEKGERNRNDREG